jgi:hypothetical protein
MGGMRSDIGSGRVVLRAMEVVLQPQQLAEDRGGAGGQGEAAPRFVRPTVGLAEWSGWSPEVREDLAMQRPARPGSIRLVALAGLVVALAGLVFTGHGVASNLHGKEIRPAGRAGTTQQMLTEARDARLRTMRYGMLGLHLVLLVSSIYCFQLRGNARLGMVSYAMGMVALHGLGLFLFLYGEVIWLTALNGRGQTSAHILRVMATMAVWLILPVAILAVFHRRAVVAAFHPEWEEMEEEDETEQALSPPRHRPL